MGHVLCGGGCRGEIVKRIQAALQEQGLLTGAIDGIFGDQTVGAVRAFQVSSRTPPSGAVDQGTWTALLGTPPPDVQERSLQVTAIFEGHGFDLAQGNFDGAGITWGIIGFTLKHGEIAKIVTRIKESHPELVQQAFGDQADQLLSLLTKAWPDQLSWANSISGGAGNARLAEPWRSSFARFGEASAVQAAQLALVQQDYFRPARVTAATYGLRAELGSALAFDIHVQNGGIKPEAQSQIASVVTKTPPANERDLRILIANAVADNANPRYQGNVRARKLTLATGEGTVNGLHFDLANWGLDETPMDSL